MSGTPSRGSGGRRPEISLRRLAPLAAQPPRLDEAQQRVVRHPGGPLLVLAGPGTGKTTTIVEAVAARVARGLPVESLLVLTYSRKAAAQLRARIAARLGVVTRSPFALTFHAYAYGLCRREAARGGLPEPRLLSGPEAELTVRRLLLGEVEEGAPGWPDSLRPALPTRGFGRELTDFLARAREQGLDGETLAGLGADRDRPDWVAAGRFWSRWAEVESLQTGGPGLSYGDLIVRAIELLAYGEAGTEERARIRGVFVDEYQDVDPGQERLLRTLAGGGRDLVAVGDPDQSIYGFRGADVGALLRFPDSFPRLDGRPAPVVALSVSRRCGAVLLAGSRRVAERLPAAPGAAHRALDPAPGTPSGEVAVHLAASTAQEAGYVADVLRRAHLLEGVPWRRMAVLVRSVVRSAAPLRRALAAARVPVVVAGDEVPLATEPAARALLLALSAAVDPDGFDEPSAQELLAGPLGGIDPLAARRWTRRLTAAFGAEPLHRVIQRPELLEQAPPPTSEAEAVDRVTRAVAAARAAAGGSAEDVLWALWSATGLSASWERSALAGGPRGAEADRALDAVVALFEAAGRFADRLPGAGAAVFLADLAGQQIPGDASYERTPAGDGVRLMTAHRAKGLEWDLVVVAGLQEGVWPDLRVTGTLLGTDELADVTAGREPSRVGALSAALAEERRLFYVATTRARRRLYLTAVAGSEDTEERPSRFIAEFVPAAADAAPVPPPRPLSLPALVGELRSVVCDPARGDRSAAAEELARLAEAGVPGADPADWYSLTDVSDRSPVAPPDALVRISPSAVDAFGRCALRWFLEQPAAARTESTAKQAIGGVVHALAASVGEAELDGKPVPDLEELTARLDVIWPELDLGGPWYSRRLRDEAVAALARFLDWRRENPRRLLGVERDFAVQVGRADLTGRVDRLEQTETGAAVVVDLKTGGQPARDRDLPRHGQLGSYQVAADNGAFGPQAHGSGGAELVQLGRGSLRGIARVQQQPPLADDPDPDWAAELLARTAAGMGGAVFAATPGEDCGHCKLHAVCPAMPEGRRVGGLP